MTDQKEITFSFGENWKSFLTTVSEREVKSLWPISKNGLGKNALSGKQ